VRFDAAKALWQARQDANEVVPLLVSFLKEDIGSFLGDVRDLFTLLAEIGPEAAAAVPELVELTRLENGHFFRDLALAALSRIVPETDEIGPVVLDILQEGEEGHDLSFCGKPAVRWVLRAWPESSLRARLRIIETLGKIGPVAAEAVPALRRMLEDPDEVVRVEAAEALAKVEGREQAEN
jgi:HEAT repeat protein